MIPKEVIEEIKSRLDIVDVVSDYLSLERVGSNYRALCPFHVETRPSFYVSPKLQMYHCFGCGAKGDVIRFVQEMENVSFQEALEKLAQRVGIDLTPYLTKGSFFSLYVSFYEELRKRYMREIWKNDEAIEYLEGRGFSREDIERFEIGYSPVGSKIVVEVAKNLNVDLEALDRFGFPQSGRDPLEGRITFPIKDDSGKTIAFGGRVVGDGEPKYMNSKETKYFSKSRILFLLDRAKSVIKGTDLVLITEGYMDAIAFHRAGFENSVAVLGTALTRYHVMRLSALTKNAVVAFDSDDSGVRASLRAISSLIEGGFNVLVVDFEDHKDADEVFRAGGSRLLEKFVEDAEDFEVFVAETLSKFFDLKTSAGVEKYAKAISNWWKKLMELGKVKSADRLVDEGSKITSLDRSSFRRMMEGRVRRSLSKSSKFGYEDLLIYLYINHEELRERIEIVLNDLREVLSDKAKEFFDIVEEHGLNLSEDVLSKDIGDWVFKILRDVPPPSNPDAVLDDVINRLRRLKIENRIKKIDEMISSTEDPKEREVLLKMRMDLVRKMKTLRRGVV